MFKIEIVDTFPNFIDYWKNNKNKPIDTQISSWSSEYMGSYPELLEKQIKSYKADKANWVNIAREKVFPFILNRFNQMEKARNNLIAIIPDISKKAKQLGLNFKVVYVIYVGIGCGAGWASTFKKNSACLLGLENIVELNWMDKKTLEGLCAHELAHLMHLSWRKKARKKSGEGSFWNLYEEGFASRFEQLITGKNILHEQKYNKNWLLWCKNNKNWLAAKFLKEHNNKKKIKKFFGSWFNIKGYKQCGYFLGCEFIKDLEKTHNIKSISLLSPKEVELLARKYLQRISVDG